MISQVNQVDSITYIKMEKTSNLLIFRKYSQQELSSSNLKEVLVLEIWTRLIGLQCYGLLVFEMKMDIFSFEEEEDCEDCDCEDCEDEE